MACNNVKKKNKKKSYNKEKKLLKEENKSLKAENRCCFEKEMDSDEKIIEFGQVSAVDSESEKTIEIISIIGEIEGHEVSSSNIKSTKYEHILPKLAQFEEDETKRGLLVLIQTCGGDVESGLAISEMIASLSKPTVSLVLGGSHSIGVPIATSTDYSFIVPTGTMVVHPVRMNGLFIGAPQTLDYFKIIQDRIVGFVSEHSKISEERFTELLMNTGLLTKDLGTILVGVEAVDEGIIDQVGGLKEALARLRKLMEERDM